MKPEFWNGKNVFITGHTGFKGSWLALWLKMLGASKITGYSLQPPTTPSLYEIASVEKSLESIIGDVNDFDYLHWALQTAQPDIVIHMAAQPLVRTSYKLPRETFAANVMGTVNLLDAVRQVDSVRSTLVVTTDKCYENQEWPWGYRETDSLGGADPYAASKACAELVTTAYRKSYFAALGKGLATARAGNVIGGGDWSDDRLIPDIMKAVIANQPVAIRNPHAVRPWQWVLEALSGYLNVVEHLWDDPEKYGTAWNFGPHSEDALPVGKIVEEIAAIWSDVDWQLDKAEHVHETGHLALDWSQARQQLGWSPKLRINDALSWTVSWYSAYTQGKEDMQAFTQSQIEQYMKGVGISKVELL